MRQHCDVTDRHGTTWHCDLHRLRLSGGAHSDVRPRARIVCIGADDTFEVDLLAADWVGMSDEDLAALLEQEAACRRASLRHAALSIPDGS